MSDTSISLLERLRGSQEETAWQRMVDLYTPLIRGWLRRYAAAEQDVDDLVQEVLAVVVRKLPEFERGPRVGSFRRWLRSIAVNSLRDSWRRQRYRPKPGDFGSVLDQLEDPESGLSKLWDQEHDELVIRRLLELIRPRFEDRTWQAFQRVALANEPVDRVAAELGMTANAVFIAKSRVMHALRQEGRDLLD